MEASQDTIVTVTLSELAPGDVPPFEYPPGSGGMVQLTSLVLTYQKQNRVHAYAEGRGRRRNKDGTPSLRTADVRWRGSALPPAVQALVDKYQHHAEYVIETAAGSSWMQEVQP